MGDLLAGIGKGLGDKLGSLVQGAVAVRSARATSRLCSRGTVGSNRIAPSKVRKDACGGQKNIVGKRFCKWTPSKLSTDLGNISKDLDPSNWGKALGLQRRLESNEVAETNAVGNIPFDNPFDLYH